MELLGCNIFLPDFTTKGKSIEIESLSPQSNILVSLQIGFGDFVPGSSNAGQVDIQLYVDYCYLLVGLAIVAMNYYMLKEEVVHKSLKFKRKLSEFCHKMMTKMDEETKQDS